MIHRNHKSIHLLLGVNACFILIALTFAQAVAQQGPDVRTRLDQLARSFQGRAQVIEYGRTLSGISLLALECLPAGEPVDSLPECVIIGGVDPRRVYSVEFVLRFAESVAAHSESYKGFRWLFIPSVAPEHYQSVGRALAARNGNLRPVDEDRDGFTDEDDSEDLNGDGFITSMRVLDPAGEWTTDPDDERVMVRKPVRRDPKAMGWRVFPEGMDDDRDGRWNEDGLGGVKFDRNFPAGFGWFKPESGAEPLSELESRYLAEFLLTRKHAALAFVIGSDDNLSQAWKADPSGPFHAVQAPDETSYELLHELYKARAVPPEASEGINKDGGSLAPWMYRQLGLWVFATPGWHMSLTPPDTSKPAEEQKRLKGRAASKNAEVQAHLYAEQQGLSSYYAPWRKVEHPDFPGQTVEVGGLIGWRAWQPSEAALLAAVERQRSFMDTVLQLWPRFEWSKPKVERLGADLFRVRLQAGVYGLLPTHTAPSTALKEAPLNRWEIHAAQGQHVVKKPVRGTFGRLKAGESHELDFVVKGAGKLRLTVGNPRMGYAQTEIDLR